MPIMQDQSTQQGTQQHQGTQQSSTQQQRDQGQRRSGRGFASMPEELVREIASKGGRAAHEKGTAHEWTPEEARAAGRKGGSR